MYHCTLIFNIIIIKSFDYVLFHEVNFIWPGSKIMIRLLRRQYHGEEHVKKLFSTAVIVNEDTH